MNDRLTDIIQALLNVYLKENNDHKTNTPTTSFLFEVQSKQFNSIIMA
jgi:hypothetical protein